GVGATRGRVRARARRNGQLPRITGALLDAMWGQVRGERGRDRGREAFEDDLLGNEDLRDWVLDWWRPRDARTVLAWLRAPELLAKVSDGLLSPEEQRLLLKSWG